MASTTATATAAATAAAAITATATTSTSTTTTTTTTTPSTPLRSEKLLRDMLTKDGVARSRSLSRSSSTAQYHQQHLPASPPPLPTSTPCRIDALSTHSRSSSITDERALLPPNAYGAPTAAHVFRPQQPPISRNTHDGMSSVPRPKLPALPIRHPTSPPALLLTHSHSPSPLSAPHSPRGRLPAAAPTAIASGSIAGAGTGTGYPSLDFDDPRDWYDEDQSPSPMSFHSSGSSSPMMMLQSGPDTPPALPVSGTSSAFDLESASEYCRQQVGYVSFGDIEGLGRPPAEEEEERRERLRLEEVKRKWAWWNWLSNNANSANGSTTTTSTSTPPDEPVGVAF